MTRRTEILRNSTALAAAALCVAGCKKEEPPPPPPPQKPAYTPPPPPPEPVNVDVLAQSVGADARVQFPQRLAPIDEGFARAALTLADSLARGDDAALRGVLTRPAQAVLDDLIGTGEWYDATDVIEAVRVVELDEGAGTLTVAVQDPDGAYPLKWRGVSFDGGTRFEGVEVRDVVLRRASDFDDGIPANDVSAVRSRSFSLETSEGGDSPLRVYVFVELNKAIQRDLGAPEAANDAVFAVLGRMAGKPADDIAELYRLGQTEFQTGMELPADERKMIVDAFVRISQAQGLTMSRERIEALLDEVLGGKDPAADPDARDPGAPVRKHTPGGPVEIPGTGRPPP